MVKLATGLLAQLIQAGKIPGLSTCDLIRAAVRQEATGQPARITLPVIYCDGPSDDVHCGMQLLEGGWAANPVTDLRLLCRWCARIARATTGHEVHTLWGDL